MRIVELDSIWIFRSTQYDKIIVQAHPAEWAQGRTMSCNIRSDHVNRTFYLYDDGSTVSRVDELEYCLANSGDDVAGDGKFSRRINSLFATEEGRYNLTIAFTDQPEGVDSVRSSLTVAADSPPVIAWESLPDSIHSGASVSPFRARVYDLDGNNDISLVIASRWDVPRGSRPRDSFAMSKTSDSLWSWEFAPEIVAGYPTGDHSFFTKATDWAMAGQEQFVFSDTVSIWMENAPPQIDSIVAPDTIWVTGSSNDSTKFFIDLYLHDDQTPLDLDSLFLTVSRFDSTIGGNRVTFKGFYFDNGRGADTLTAPGLIRTSFSATRNNPLDVPYTFDWIPSDRSPQNGAQGSNTMRIMLVGNGVLGRDQGHEGTKTDFVTPFR